MSDWGKFLAQVSVLTGETDFVFVDGAGSHTAQVLPGDYDSVLSLANILESKIQAEAGGTPSVEISSTGYCTITISGLISVTWGSCSSRLMGDLGYALTESVSGGAVAATNAHKYGWYPGVVSYGTARGEGVAEDTGWYPVDSVGRQVAGSGAARLIGPSRMAYTRRLGFGTLHRDEVLKERDRGVICFADRWATKEFRWYPDRDDGTVSSYGTQGDPADYDTDSTCDFWVATLTEQPRVDPGAATHPDYFHVSLVLNGEPA